EKTMTRQLEIFHQRALPDLAANIKCGNSLIGPDYFTARLLPDPEELRRVNPFDWQAQFPEAMKDGGFDCVFGNPPYRMLQPHNTTELTLNHLRKNYFAADFKIDFFHLFLQLGVSHLKEKGFLGFIVPVTLLHNVYIESLRTWIMERCCIEEIAVAQGRVFEKADVHTCVVVLSREPSSEKRSLHGVKTSTHLERVRNSSTLEHRETPQASFRRLPGRVWNVMLDRRNSGLIFRLKKDYPALGAIAKINRGLITGSRDHYFSKKPLSKKYVPIIAGGDVHRYYVQPPSEFVLFERPDSAGGCWAPDVHFSPHKIVIRQICERPTAAILLVPMAVTGNVFTIRMDAIEDETYLLALLNSSLVAFFWRIMFSDFKESFPQVTIFSLSQAPVCVHAASDQRHSDSKRRVILHAGQMLELHKRLHAADTRAADRECYQRQIAATDREIDRLVYDLYGLTEDEIRIVNESE
ncbi:MAG: Eco57I restriction-modification methylase domain-containing protein, partial [Candidatus Sumerlaeota bacterium]|nr:Eco57I restriction-modification methylase domain-containing protein [Candidatus Sumerlaeota bacterium]